MDLLHCEAVVNSVLSPDLNELTVSADLRYSEALFHRWGEKKLNAASARLVLILGTPG